MKQIRLKPVRISSDYMLPRKSFVVGMGSILNIRGQYFSYKTSSSAKKADSKAIEKDWQMVGKDLEDAKKQLSRC